MDEHETIADTIAEMKRRKEMLEDAAFNAPLCYSTETVQAQYEILDEFIERFEAAHKRERGDCAKLREAVEICLYAFQKTDWTTIGTTRRVVDLIQRCKSALAAPARNCDVLETEELIRQHNSFCGNSKNSYKCINASASECRRCLAKFMQMPYVDKKGGAK